MRKYIKDMNDAWEVVRLDVDHELGVGDIVLFVGRIHYRGKGSGVEAESRSGYVLTIREGRAVRLRQYLDRAEALEAVGLSRHDAHANS